MRACARAWGCRRGMQTGRGLTSHARVCHHAWSMWGAGIRATHTSVSMPDRTSNPSRCLESLSSTATPTLLTQPCQPQQYLLAWHRTSDTRKDVCRGLGPPPNDPAIEVSALRFLIFSSSRPFLLLALPPAQLRGRCSGTGPGSRGAGRCCRRYGSSGWRCCCNGCGVVLLLPLRLGGSPRPLPRWLHDVIIQGQVYRPHGRWPVLLLPVLLLPVLLSSVHARQQQLRGIIQGQVQHKTCSLRHRRGFSS